MKITELLRAFKAKPKTTNLNEGSTTKITELFVVFDYLDSNVYYENEDGYGKVSIPELGLSFYSHSNSRFVDWGEQHHSFIVDNKEEDELKMKLIERSSKYFYVYEKYRVYCTPDGEYLHTLPTSWFMLDDPTYKGYDWLPDYDHYEVEEFLFSYIPSIITHGKHGNKEVNIDKEQFPKITEMLKDKLD